MADQIIQKLHLGKVTVNFGKYQFTNNDAEEFLKTLSNSEVFDMWTSDLEELDNQEVTIDFNQKHKFQRAKIDGTPFHYDHGGIEYGRNKIGMAKIPSRMMFPVVKDQFRDWELDPRFITWLKERSIGPKEPESTNVPKVFYLYRDRVFEKIEVERTSSVSEVIEMYRNVVTGGLLLSNALAENEIIPLTEDQITAIAKVTRNI